MKGERKRSSKVVWVVLVAMMGALVLSGCSSASQPTPQAMPTGMTYSGLWYSQQYEHMYLHQQGNRVEGVYTRRGGGTIEGTVDGNLLTFDWFQPGDRGSARRDMRGTGYFHLVVTDGEPELVGHWGYDDDAMENPWNAEFIREREGHDPTTLEGLDRRR